MQSLGRRDRAGWRNDWGESGVKNDATKTANQKPLGQPTTYYGLRHRTAAGYQRFLWGLSPSRQDGLEVLLLDSDTTNKK